jgi:cobalt-zinc-cadmium efflux system protein
MGHNHDHHHHHDAEMRIGFAFWLNLFFAAIELVGGFYTNSMAIVSDSLHDFGDALSLGIAWTLERKSKKGSHGQFSYGMRRLSTISALLTGLILILASLIILSESIPRLMNPQEPNTTGMIYLALLGVAVNGLAFFRLRQGHSLNEKILTWHFIEDMAGWLLVLFGAVFMKFVYFPSLDAALAILLSCWVIWNVSKTMKEALKVFLQAAPAHIILSDLKEFICRFPGVKDAHHLHLWSIDGDSHVLTAHVVLQMACDIQQMAETKKILKSELESKFQIKEATLEFEWPSEDCVDPQHH